MKKRSTGTVIAAAAAIGPALTGGAALTGAAAVAQAPLPRVMTCAGKVVMKPTSYVVTCADANTYFNSVHWKNWGTRSATATATLVQNDCIPYCAAGKFKRYPATLTFSVPRSTKYGTLFSKLNYSYTVAQATTLPLRPLSSVTGGTVQVASGR